ncbi:MAG: macrolide ABC transporter ATP-binding protein [Bacteroidetes bacterium MED-G17]|nr:MAG: macrolide ABC transporter ATP-binding protein [Bacteroidetes bacterium TMED39]PDH53490.1 MAG: macrolide ABC transporter ATP-binding protein [Bacteroidetes bacterium MED-G17]
MNIIELKNIFKIYTLGKTKLYALNGVDLSIQKSDYLALMGPSGSGKSTLMNIIGALDTASSGTYILNQQEINQLNDNDLAQIRNKEIGFVFQSFNLLPRMTAIENVAIPLIYAGISKTERLERAEKALNSVGLSDRMSHKPNELSGGQRQRVAIARSLINNPSIILADEPTGNLDSKSSADIMNIFAEINEQGNTVVMVTHEEDIAQNAKRIVRMRDGKIENLYENRR